jgi:hypothetical protein
LEAWHDYFGGASIDFNASATNVSFDDFMLRVQLVDGREIAVPLEYFPRLRDASQAELSRYEIVGDGYGIHWDHLDKHLSVKGLMRLH